MLKLDFTSPFDIFGTAAFKCFEYFCGELWPGATGYSGGQGSSLFRRKIGSTGVPVAVSGSAARRMWAITSFTRDDGLEMLVGLGMLTADLFVSGYSALDTYKYMTPAPLRLFTSTDGTTWTTWNLGNIEKRSGPWTPASLAALTGGAALIPPYQNVAHLLNSRSELAFVPTINDDGKPATEIATGLHIVNFDGYKIETKRIRLYRDHSLTQAMVEHTGGQLDDEHYAYTFYRFVKHGGKYYFAGFANVGATSISFVNEGYKVGRNEGVVEIFTPLGNTIAPDLRGFDFSLQGDNEFNLLNYHPGLPTLNPFGQALEGFGFGEINGHVTGGEFINGRWIFAGTRAANAYSYSGGEFEEPPIENTICVAATTGLITKGLIPLPGLIQRTFAVDWAGAQTIVDNNSTYNEMYRIAVRKCGSRLYLCQRPAAYEVSYEYDATRAALDVFSLPFAGAVADFTITAAIALGTTDNEGALLGTYDGYLLGYAPRLNMLNSLGHVSSPILKLLRKTIGAETITYIQTGNTIYGALDSSMDANGQLTFTSIYTAPAGYTISDMLSVSGNRLVIISSNGTDSKVSLYSVSATSPVLIRTDSYAATVLTKAGEFSSNVRIFSNSATGEVKLYNASNVASSTTVADLANENVTAVAVEASYLWVGTASGELWRFDGATWVLKTTVTGHPLTNIAVDDGVIYIASHDDSGNYWVYGCEDATTLTTRSLNNSGGWNSGSCASNSYGFLFLDTHWALTSRGIAVIPECTTGGGGIGDDATTHRLFVTKVDVQKTPVKEVLITIIGLPLDEQDNYAVYVRVDNETPDADDLGSYQVALLDGWTQLNKAGRNVRVAVQFPIGDKRPAVAMEFHRDNSES